MGIAELVAKQKSGMNLPPVVTPTVPTERNGLSLGNILMSLGAGLDTTGRTTQLMMADEERQLQRQRELDNELKKEEAARKKLLVDTLLPVAVNKDGSFSPEDQKVARTKLSEFGVELPELSGAQSDPTKLTQERADAINSAVDNLVAQLPEEDREMFSSEMFLDPVKRRDAVREAINLEKNPDIEKLDLGDRVVFHTKGNPDSIIKEIPKGKVAAENTLKTVQAFLPDQESPVSLLQDEQGNFFNMDKTPVTLSKDARVVSGKLQGGSNDLGLGTKAIGQIETDLVDIEQKLGRIDEISTFLEDEEKLESFLNVFTQGKNAILSSLERLAPNILPEEQKQSIENFEDFKATIANNLNTTIKELSGAAVTQSESERLSKELPTTELSISQFKGRIKSRVRALGNAKKRLLILRAKGFSDSEISGMMKSNNAPFGIESNQRIKQEVQEIGEQLIKDEGLSEEEAADRLVDMGLI